MVRWPMLALFGLAGCTTVSDLREAPFFAAQSAKPVQQVASCIAGQWQARSGVTNTTPRPNGQSLALTYNVFSNTLPAAVVDVDAAGEGSAVTVYARSGDRTDKLRAEVEGCV